MVHLHLRFDRPKLGHRPPTFVILSTSPRLNLITSKHMSSCRVVWFFFFFFVVVVSSAFRPVLCALIYLRCKTKQAWQFALCGMQTVINRDTPRSHCNRSRKRCARTSVHFTRHTPFIFQFVFFWKVKRAQDLIE